MYANICNLSYRCKLIYNSNYFTDWSTGHTPLLSSIHILYTSLFKQGAFLRCHPHSTTCYRSGTIQVTSNYQKVLTILIPRNTLERCKINSLERCKKYPRKSKLIETILSLQSDLPTKSGRAKRIVCRGYLPKGGDWEESAVTPWADHQDGVDVPLGESRAHDRHHAWHRLPLPIPSRRHVCPPPSHLPPGLPSGGGVSK